MHSLQLFEKVKEKILKILETFKQNFNEILRKLQRLLNDYLSFEQEMHYFCSRLIQTAANQQFYWGHSTFYWWGTAPCALSTDPEILLENLLICTNIISRKT